jgi:hypothetical protein
VTDNAVVNVWSALSGNLLQTFDGYYCFTNNTPPSAVVFAPDGMSIVYASDTILQLCDFYPDFPVTSDYAELIKFLRDYMS